MTNLKLTPRWTEGVYQLEKSDPVIGGADGVDNRQAKELGCRTEWLKQQFTTLADQKMDKTALDQALQHATLNQRGIVQLTNVYSEFADDLAQADETKAVTPKALKQSNHNAIEFSKQLATEVSDDLTRTFNRKITELTNTVNEKQHKPYVYHVNLNHLDPNKWYPVTFYPNNLERGRFAHFFIQSNAGAEWGTHGTRERNLPRFHVAMNLTMAGSGWGWAYEYLSIEYYSYRFCELPPILNVINLYKSSQGLAFLRGGTNYNIICENTSANVQLHENGYHNRNHYNDDRYLDDYPVIENYDAGLEPKVKNPLGDFLVGVPIPYPSNTVPSGFLAMNGQAFSTTTYPRLAQLYPSGRLPDLRGLFIRGVGGSSAGLLEKQQATRTVLGGHNVDTRNHSLLNNDLGRETITGEAIHALSLDESASDFDLSQTNLDMTATDQDTANVYNLWIGGEISSEHFNTKHAVNRQKANGHFIGYVRPVNMAFQYICLAA